jgi:class 3 adenylate cyclase
VGKKLSELTTRRVIMLVLTMLLVLPFLRTNSADNLQPSPYYGADDVYKKWQQWVERPSSENSRKRYEDAVLKYVYYHNWYTRECKQSDTFQAVCPGMYSSHVFWIGVTGSLEKNIRPGVNSTRLRLSSVQEWNQYAASQQDIYNYGTMPDDVLQTIAGEWSDDCNDGPTKPWTDKDIYRHGFSVIGRESEDVGYAVPCPVDLRPLERRYFYSRLLTSEKYNEWHFSFYFDARPYTREEARWGIIMTGFICVVLCIASLQFSNDANKMVLRPVETMIKRIEAIRQNPLIAMRMADEEFQEEFDREEKRKKSHNVRTFKELFNGYCMCSSAGGREAAMETVILEKTIIKLGSLLALGFGEAGANIIGHNLGLAASASVNAMIQGTRVECIVGKARIQDFSTATEVLQARVMAFVNQIAEIVHGVVDEMRGAANKNNGDTFLLVWRISGHDKVIASRYADMSMLSFAKIFGAVHSSPVLAAYRAHPGLQQRLGSNCRVCLSFGLHAGWAIEGAVGSEFKIDASYLSPNVSIASSVEFATKMYGVPILISQTVIDMGSTEMGEQCRLVDRVVIRGSTAPMELYALDLDYEPLQIEELPCGVKRGWNLRERFKVRQFLEVEKTKHVEHALIEEFEADAQIILMRERYTVDFFMMFHMGFQNYAHGEWDNARKFLANARRMLKGIDDGPSRALLHYMELHDYKPPEGWAGTRELSKPTSD